MAEMVPHDYATKADLDVFKAEIVQAITEMRAEMRVDLANTRKDMADLRAEYSQRVPLYAAIGGLGGGLIAAVAKIF
jgi:hypothetical protein